MTASLTTHDSLNAQLPSIVGSKRYLLCRPLNGFADSLGAIETAWRYAEEYDRYFIIDSRYSGLMDDFSRYFSLKRKKSRACLSLSEADLDYLNGLPTVPRAMQGQLRMDSIACGDADNIFTAGDRFDIPLPSNGLDCEEACVFSMFKKGGYPFSYQALDRLVLRDQLIEYAENILARIGPDYEALHVRNTDYKTDYKIFFEEIAPQVRGKTLLACSDDAACIDYARQYFTGTNIVVSSHIPDTQGRRLHENSHLDRFSTNRDMLTDLLALALAKKIYFTNVSALYGTKLGRLYPSGYAVLAQQLSKRRDIIEGLLKRS